MTRTLLEISEDLLALRDLIEDSATEDGEISLEAAAALEAWFGEVEADRDTKLDNYAALIRDLTLRAAARLEEKERLAKRVQVDENAVKRLKERLKLFLELQGVKKVETDRYRISVCANGGKQPLQVLADVKDLPAEYQRVKIEADNEKLRAAVEAGQEIPGVKLLARGTHIRIA